MKPLVLVVLAGCGFAGVPGSGNAKSEVRQVGAFRALVIAGAIDADVAIGEARVEIRGDDNLLPLITTEVDGNDLRIGTRRSLRPSVPLVAHITVPQLGAVRVIGSSTVTLHGVHADDLALGVTGSATIRGDGAVRQLHVEISGSGTLELEQIAAERAAVSISGSGDAALAVAKALDVTISGSGDVTYRGDPEVKKHISGSGSVTRK